MKSFSLIKGLLIFSVLALQSVVSSSQTPNWLWAKAAGGVSDGRWLSTATDASGNVYVAGAFETPTIQFGSIVLNNVGGPDVFLVKYNPSGTVVWAKSAGGGANEFANGIAIDPSGNILVAGAYFSSTISFGTLTLTKTGYYDVFLAKYDTAGNVMWAKTSSGATASSGDEAISVSVSNSGSIYISGYFTSASVNFGTATLNSVGGSDMFLVKYYSNGTVAWARSIGGPGNEGGSSTTTDGAGNLSVAGTYNSSSISIGSSTLNNLGSYDTYLAKYDSSGTALWAKSGGGGNSDEPTSIEADLSGNIFMTGQSNSNTYAFGTASLNTSGSYDAFITKYDPSGTVLWARSGAGTGADYGQSIATDALGNAYVSGYFASPIITFGTTIMNNAGNNDIFVAKYDATGTVQWVKAVGGASDDRGYAIAVNPSGEVINAGYFHSSPTTFGTFTLNNASSPKPDMYVAKISNPLSINKLRNKEVFAIYPNPTTGRFTFDCSGSNVRKIEIVDLMGRSIFQNLSVHSNTETIDLSGKPQGVYFIKLYTENSISSEKVELR